MRALFVYSNITCACTRKCCFELSEALNRYIPTDTIYFNEFNREIIDDYDIVIFQRVGTAANVQEEDKKEILSIIEENKQIKKFAYLIDDLVLDAQGGTPKRFIQSCNAAICTSRTLERYVKKYNENVYIFHTFIEFDLYESVPFTEYDKFTLVWVSTGGLGKDIIREIINNRDSMGMDFNLIAIGGHTKEFEEVKNVETYPILSEYEMIEKIKGADILLNPMSVSEDIEPTLRVLSNGNITDFLNCKSEVKYAIAGAAQICLLTSPIENYSKVVKNMENGVIINDDPEEWIKMIEYLFENREIINRIKINAYNEVKNEYTKEVVAKEFYEIINEIIDL